MAWFKKKEMQTNTMDSTLSGHIHIMPKEFLTKPMVARKGQVEAKPVVQTPMTPKPIQPPTPVIQSEKLTIPAAKKSYKGWYIGGGIALSLILLVIFSYFFFLRPAPVVVTNQTQNIVNTPTTNQTNQTPETPTNTTTTPPVPVVIPRILSSALDTDNDGLTDVEEVYFQTDGQLPDMDEDTFPDGLEVRNLYNPTGFAPVRIVDSGVVDTFRHPSANYEVFFPKGWDSQTLLESPLETVITPPDQAGEYFSVQVIENPDRLPLVTWYIRDILPGVSPTRIKRMTNRRGNLDGILSLDEQTAYFSVTDKIYAIKYHSGTATQLNFKSTFVMMYESFTVSPATAIFPFLNQSTSESSTSEEQTQEGIDEESTSEETTVSEEDIADTTQGTDDQVQP